MDFFQYSDKFRHLLVEEKLYFLNPSVHLRKVTCNRPKFSFSLKILTFFGKIKNMKQMSLSQCFGYPRVLGTSVPMKTLVFWVSPVGIPKTLIPGAMSVLECETQQTGERSPLFLLIILGRFKTQDSFYYSICSPKTLEKHTGRNYNLCTRMYTG